MNLLTQTPVRKITFPLQAPKILIIEDDSCLTEILVEFFHSIGYIVRTFSGSEDILPLTEQFNPDIVVLDYLLPNINGGELCSQIKRNAETKHIPVIIYSAFPRVMLSLGNYGCDAFVPKPFDLFELVDQIETLLSKRHLHYQTAAFV